MNRLVTYITKNCLLRAVFAGTNWESGWFFKWAIKYRQSKARKRFEKQSPFKPLAISNKPFGDTNLFMQITVSKRAFPGWCKFFYFDNNQNVCRSRVPDWMVIVWRLFNLEPCSHWLVDLFSFFSNMPL